MKKLESSLTNMLLVLTLVSVVAAFLLAFVNKVTSSTIAEINAETLSAGIKSVLGVGADEQITTNEKDVDGFHPVNAGRLSIGLPCFLSATPNGIMELLRRYNIDTKGKKCVVLGRSNIVGKPVANLMMQKQIPGDATVTVCHSHTVNIAEECRQADIIIAALGQPHFLKADMVKEGAVVIDVGTTRVPDATRKSGFRLCGDVDFDNVAPKCSYITPVPGGVGPMTIVSLMKNTLLAGKREIYR